LKTKSLLIEPFLVAKVVLCWILALPVLVLLLSGLAIWDEAISPLIGVRIDRQRAPVGT